MFSILSRQGSINYNHFKFHVTLAIIKKTKDNKFWRGCGARGTLIHWGWA